MEKHSNFSASSEVKAVPDIGLRVHHFPEPRTTFACSPQKRRPRQYRARRPRRARFGLMLLTDASRHDWLEGRGPRLTLIGFQDDATSRVVAARFQLEAENATGYFRCLHTLLTTHGIPLSLYRDRHGIFQRNDPYWSREEELAGQQFPTQVGRALEELGIQQIPANSPQAKGRIERLWRTFQDRLISELRLASGLHSGSGQCRAGSFPGRLQPPLYCPRRRIHQPLSPPAPPL